MRVIRTRSTEAGSEWITRESVVAEANWTVVDDPAIGVHAAGVGARVCTLLAGAGASHRAV